MYMNNGAVYQIERFTNLFGHIGISEYIYEIRFFF